MTGWLQQLTSLTVYSGPEIPVFLLFLSVLTLNLPLKVHYNGGISSSVHALVCVSAE